LARLANIGRISSRLFGDAPLKMKRMEGWTRVDSESVEGGGETESRVGSSLARKRRPRLDVVEGELRGPACIEICAIVFDVGELCDNRE